MYCPRCGQQQAANEVRFCSRCGFPLSAVSGLLAAGGETPEQGPAVESPRRRGVRQGAALLMIGIFLIPLFFMAHEILGTPDELAMTGILFFIGGVLRMIYAAFFEAGAARAGRARLDPYVPPQALAGQGARGAAALPPPQSFPARDLAAAGQDTSELSYRPSVTEGTTRLLDERGEEPPR